MVGDTVQRVKECQCLLSITYQTRRFFCGIRCSRSKIPSDIVKKIIIILLCLFYKREFVYQSIPNSPIWSEDCSFEKFVCEEDEETYMISHNQVGYIFGHNPRVTSYMVGYRNNYPRQVHHTTSSIASIKVNPSFVTSNIIAPAIYACGVDQVQPASHDTFFVEFKKISWFKGFKGRCAKLSSVTDCVGNTY
ncbi:endoglucanase 6 [Artemisia annua]|uniref:cellulase n=1 Tax=Artemisia annua TaxID=35608 RepID=A0A2U1PE08_ARTAN|nr:endoglucanase 6 [Artemisia annua]